MPLPCFSRSFEVFSRPVPQPFFPWRIAVSWRARGVIQEEALAEDGLTYSTP
jgi:hypothetical protein